MGKTNYQTNKDYQRNHQKEYRKKHDCEQKQKYREAQKYIVYRSV